MNIYKIKFSHTAPKDTEIGMYGLLLAENEEQVYEFIKSEPEIGGRTLINDWEEREDEEGTYEIYDENYHLAGHENWKEKMLRIKGEMNDEEYDYSDAYYGITLYGWELVVENTTESHSELIKYGAIISLTTPNKGE